MIIRDCEQGSDEWLALRLGHVTSSGADNVLPMSALFPAEKSTRDNKESRDDYALRLAIERITGVPADDSFKSVAMERGTRLEPSARERYRAEHPDYEVITPGFLVAPGGQRLGDSPDGIVLGAEGCFIGGWEGKCPSPRVHQGYRDAGVVPRAYLRQMLHHLTVVETAQWWDFTSFHPLFPGRTAWFEVRLERHAAQAQLDIYRAALVEFLKDVDALEARLRGEA